MIGVLASRFGGSDAVFPADSRRKGADHVSIIPRGGFKIASRFGGSDAVFPADSRRKGADHVSIIPRGGFKIASRLFVSDDLLSRANKNLRFFCEISGTPSTATNS